MKPALLPLLLGLFVSLPLAAQSSYTANQQVEVLWKERWYKATILSASAKTYKVHYDGYGSSWDETVPASRIRPLSSPGSPGKAALKYGKYGCSASRYVSGQYEYSPKGSFVLARNGTYAYYGFDKPSTGKFTVAASGVISFSGGYFNGGEATPMVDRENRYYVVFPNNPDNRWTCSWVAAK
ncbi:hypothetical protein EJV47_10045 [Hymenobacter gummosus]|uniref:Tudor domain-containing protein n=1 Tax=Hymenobacter gummosus TaxID=1776032 RepID=A0A3S0JEA7_9BACT|nr:agenet domain-containing protein [Hymenobacter gummosus]RTQ49977.1 hypothetical protein EJV47_10045 [Hymenobacter gummosus]